MINSIVFCTIAFLMASGAIGLAVLLCAIFCRIIDKEE